VVYRAVLNRASVLRGLLLVLAGTLLVGCGGTSYKGNGGINKPISTGYLRLVNTLPDSPTLLVGVDGQTLTRVSFAQATGLQQVAVGKYAIDVQYLDPKGNTVKAIDKERLDITTDVQATLFLVGTLGQPHTHKIENDAAAPAAGSAQVQVIQTVSGQPSLDVYLTDAAADLATAPKLATVAYDESTPLTTVPSGANYRLRVTAAGSSSVLYDSGAFTLVDTSRVTFAVVNYFGPGGAGFRVVQLNSQNASVFPNEVLPGAFRIANMIADVAAVDLYIGPVTGTPAFGGVAFGTVAPLQEFPAGTLDCTLTVAGNPLSVLYSGPVALNSGETRTLVPIRSAGSVSARATVDTTRPVTGESQFEVINATTAGALDTYLLGPGETLANATAAIVNQPVLAFAGAVKAPDTYGVTFTTTATKTPIAGPSSLATVDGGIYSVIVFDAAGGGSPYQIVFSSN
jgi:hypothetical protein